MASLGDYLPLLLRGTLVTIQISVLSYLLALVLGILGAAARVRRGARAAKAAVFLYTTLVRGIPDIALILLVYAGGQQLANAIARTASLDRLILSPFCAGVLAVGLIYGAYLVETFRGALLAVPAGQSEAASALGLPRRLAFLLVVLPQAIPGLISTGIIAMNVGWSEYLFGATLLTSPDNLTISPRLESFMGRGLYNWGWLLAGSIAVTAPLILVAGFMQRHLIGGWGAGALKG